MNVVGEALAVVVVAIIFVVLLAEIMRSWRDGVCGTRGWGPFTRESEPMMYWIVMGLHAGLAAGVAVLIATWLLG